MWGGVQLGTSQLLQQLSAYLRVHGTTSYVSNLMAACAARPLDLIYSRLGGLRGDFFSSGWGNLGVVDFDEDVKFMMRQEQELKISWKLVQEGRESGQEFKRFEGTFTTPCTGRIWDALPPECRTGRAQLLVPRGATQQTACAVHLAATGDQTYDRRLRLAFPLLQHGVAALVLESPYYGGRRPEGQVGAKLRHVSDLLVLGWSTISETLHLLHWAQQGDFPQVGVTGLSMGGVHACMAVGLYRGEASCTPLLAPRSAAVAYCDGALRNVTAWPALLTEHDAHQNEVLAVVAAASRAIHTMRAGHKALEAIALRAAPHPSPSPSPPPPSPTCPTSSPVLDSPSSLPDPCTTTTRTTQHPHPQPSPARGPTAPHHLAAGAPLHPLGCPPAERLALPLRPTSQPHIIRQSPLDTQAWDPLITPLVAPPTPSTPADPRLCAEEVEAAMLRGVASGGEPPSEALRRLKGVLEAFTDITRYPRPRRPDAAVLVAAQQDAYVALESVEEVHRYWPGSELRCVPGGHVSAFLTQQGAFRQALLDSLHRLQRPMPPP